MHIVGQLKDDILQGKLVLFLGAGASKAAGLHTASELAEHLFIKAGSSREYGSFKNDLVRLVSRLDQNQSFTRQWVQKQLAEYFLDKANYANLSWHKKLLQLRLQAVFTTNYDICLELADFQLERSHPRLIPLVDANDEASIFGLGPGILPYYKLHGCCKEQEEHRATAPPLVITRADFRQSLNRNKNFFLCLHQWAYNSSIVFLGFQAQQAEADYLLSNVLDAVQHATAVLQKPFVPFAVLPNLDAEKWQDLIDSGLTPVDGRFEDFIEAAYQLTQSAGPVVAPVPPKEGKVVIQVQGHAVELSSAEVEQYKLQFQAYHDRLLEFERARVEGLTVGRRIDLWKSGPSTTLLAADLYIHRDDFVHAKGALDEAVKWVTEKRAPYVIWLTGKRGCGKSTVALQLLRYAYAELGQPALQLNPEAHHYGVIETRPALRNIEVSEWDEPVVDKFLSLFYKEGTEESDEGRVVPVLLADHVLHKASAIDRLVHYLENHGKPCVLILTASEEELAAQESAYLEPSARYVSRLENLVRGSRLTIEHRLSDGEIDSLFQVVSRLEPRVKQYQDMLIERAKIPNYGDRDILFILYTWFDQRFRKLEEIIIDEVERLKEAPVLYELYLATSVFHQYHIHPPLAVCAEGVGLDPESFFNLRGTPLFKAFIDTSFTSERTDDLGSTRHPIFARLLLQQTLPDINEQVNLMARVLRCCDKTELEFARSWMAHLYEFAPWLTSEQIGHMKLATEERLADDYVINHQYAAYLIRQNVKLDDARYYLDRSLAQCPDNSSIIHSLGNLTYRLYQEKLLSDPPTARAHFDQARRLFRKSRALGQIDEEHGYYTDIAMLWYRVQNDNDQEEAKVLLDAERQALLFEAVRVVPRERQNLLRNLLGKENAFHELPSDQQNILAREIEAGRASAWLLEYYGRSQLSRPRARTWHRLFELLTQYWPQATGDIATATVLCLLAKCAFIKNAESRFDLLQPFYDKAVRYQEVEINFATLAEYVRLLFIDAFVLGRYQFLRSSAADIVELFRHAKPRFLGEEYVFPASYYMFDENAEHSLIDLFTQSGNVFSDSSRARRFERSVRLGQDDEVGFVRIEMDPVTRYYVRAPRQEIATKAGVVTLNFIVKHTANGLLATGFRT